MHRNAILGLVALLALGGSEGRGDSSLLSSDVYYGKVEDSKKPAEVVSSKVFEEIPEMKEIKKRGLTEKDAEYWILLAKACEKFYAAVKKVAEADGYDCVAEKGKYTFNPPAPDITQKVIDALEK